MLSPVWFLQLTMHNGDPYVGLERAGIPGWIKDGKDPEEEWRKKYPPETP